MDNFIDDKDLMFLYNCSNENLKLLAEVVIFDKDGKKRWSSKHSTDKDFDDAYYANNIKSILPIVIDELQRYGGNSIFNTYDCIKDTIVEFGHKLGFSTKESRRYFVDKFLQISTLYLKREGESFLVQQFDSL